MKLAVIGAGVAGSAAAWAASRAGAEVVVIADRSGASELYPGAIDLEAWERDGDATPDADVLSFVTALGLWTISPERCFLATPAGVVRSARGRDGALLDLLPLAGKSVAVADVIRDDWDAPLVARGLSASSFARDTNMRFSAVELPLSKLAEARSISAWDFAHGFDTPERLEELASLLASARQSHDAWLMGPWLGTRPGVAETLRARIGMPVGESISPPGGAAGARFEHARDELLAGLDRTTRIQERVTAIDRGGNGWRVTTTNEGLTADSVVLASGGVAAGGIALDGARPDHPGGACFHLPFTAPVTLELDGLAIDGVSSLYGVDFAARGLGTLERIGIACDGLGVRGAPGLYAAGDAVSGRARTVLEAVSSGIRAAQRALAPSDRGA